MSTTFSPIPAPTLLNALNWRYATKAFDTTKKIPAETWKALEETLVLSPSSFGLQPWKFIVITDQSIKDQLVPHAWGQVQVSQCSHLVVLAAKTSVDEAYVDSFLKRTAELRHVPVDSLKGYRDIILGSINGPLKGNIPAWAKLQCYIALGNIMTSAALLGIDTCPMEGFVPAEFDKILGLEAKGLTAAVLCPAGYRAETDKYAHLAKVRFAVDQVIEHI